LRWNGRRNTLRRFAFCGKELHQILDLIGLKNVSKSGHRSATVVNLMLDLLLVPPFAYEAEIRTAVAAAAICAVTVFAPPLVKQNGSSLFIRAGIGVNRGLGRLRQTRYKGQGKSCGSDGNQDSQQCVGVFLQKNSALQ
jgi:hypothetical protein